MPELTDVILKVTQKVVAVADWCPLLVILNAEVKKVLFSLLNVVFYIILFKRLNIMRLKKSERCPLILPETHFWIHFNLICIIIQEKIKSNITDVKVK